MKVIILVVLVYVAFESAQGWSIRHSDFDDEVVDEKGMKEADVAEVMAGTVATTVKGGKATAKPGKASAKPGKASVKPGKASVKPGKASVKPGKASAKPGKATAKPAKATMKPAKASVKPGHSQQGKKPAPMELPVVSP